MHEVALVDAIVRVVAKEIGEARVHRVQLRVGTRAAVSLDALRFCFFVCVRGTALDGASLQIVETDTDELLVEEVELS
jgi:hydrogenase nickel incorporation protein HypA/HybF